MPPTITRRQLRALSVLSLLLSVASAGCAGPTAGSPSALPPVSGTPTTASSSYADQPSPPPAGQLHAVAQVVRTAIRRFNHQAQRTADRVRIVTFIPRIDTATAADVFVALERGRHESEPLLDREFQLRLERGRWRIAAVDPT